MLVEDIMTKDVLSVHPQTSVYDAAKILVDNGVSGLPVLDTQGKLVGIVSEKDLIVILDFLGTHQAKDARISECMTKDIVVCAPDMKTEDAARLLVQRNIKRMPVVADDKLVGVVSRRDILKGVL